MQVTKRYFTETGHRLNHYDGKCSHLHGHTYQWEVTVQSNNLTDNGMVTDFKELKAVMIQILEPFDHAMVLANDDPLIKLFPSNLEEVLRATNGARPRIIIFPVNPTAENFATWAAENIQKVIWEDPDCTDVLVTKVRVWETRDSFAEWNYEDNH